MAVESEKLLALVTKSDRLTNVVAVSGGSILEGIGLIAIGTLVEKVCSNRLPGLSRTGKFIKLGGVGYTAMGLVATGMSLTAQSYIQRQIDQLTREEVEGIKL